MARDPYSASEHSCPSCDTGPFARNAYWMGKLMMAADFIAEQDYLIEKLRHHNQRLHGWGVVCGLKVVQHELSDCRARYVCVEPGSAVDCCGYDIVLRERECIDLLAIPALRALHEAHDTSEHTLRICIRYRECATEQVPVLYDECGCDEDRCAPNRILESWELDVLVLPSPLPEEPLEPPVGDCAELWKRSLDACPTCEQADCVVLATIDKYVAGNALVDPPVPPTEVPDDARRIDNLAGRKLLPAAAAIQEVLDCVLGGGAGGSGAPGRGIDEVVVDFVECPAGGPKPAGESSFNEATRTLHLTIPEGCPGRNADPAPPLALPRIVNINWKHGADNLDRVGMLNRVGLVIAFDRPVLADTLNEQTVQVLKRIDEGDRRDQLATYCYCNIQGRISPLMVEATCTEIGSIGPPGADGATGVQFMPLGPGDSRVDWPRGEYRVVLEGDQILGTETITIVDPFNPGLRIDVHPALDANHLAPGLGSAPGRCPTGNGTEGGRFLSWFTIREEG